MLSGATAKSAAQAKTLDPLPTIAVGSFHHDKGNRYELMGVARHSETHEALVVYRPLHGEGALWVRPCEMFAGTSLIDGMVQPRFAPD